MHRIENQYCSYVSNLFYNALRKATTSECTTTYLFESNELITIVKRNSYETITF